MHFCIIVVQCTVGSIYILTGLLQAGVLYTKLPGTVALLEMNTRTSLT